jgi:hypothetical protein
VDTDHDLRWKKNKGRETRENYHAIAAMRHLDSFLYLGPHRRSDLRMTPGSTAHHALTAHATHAQRRHGCRTKRASTTHTLCVYSSSALYLPTPTDLIVAWTHTTKQTQLHTTPGLFLTFSSSDCSAKHDIDHTNP